ncbi:MAG TPA: biotin/lipoate A/B protein ligase family protein [Candidatus Thermoplasmatota archaeon]|nr:biotin/lipoate A/B protein ligase family protein [Candidatus Thermoplasmatota archaeon]
MMTEEWRLLQTGLLSAAENMAIDRAILVAHSKGHVPPTVRLYGWNPAAISIGYFQQLTEEVDLTACEKDHIDYVRRITGGGAVFHEDEVTYSFVIQEKHPQISKNILESYKTICLAIMNGLDFLGVKSTYAPINDILVNNKKISGNAQTRKQKTVLQHGTILTDVDVDKMFRLLKVPNEKIKGKMIANVKERVTSLTHELGSDFSFEDVSNALKKGFEETFDVTFTTGILTDEEKTLATSFQKTTFGSKKWNHQR